MTAIAATAPRIRRRRSGLPPLARPYHSLVLAGAAAIALASLQTMGPQQPWLLFAALAVAASAAQLFVVRNGRNQSYHTAITFMFVGVLTLPPALLVLLVVVMHVPEWLKHRYAWYIQSFNIANYVLDAFAARATVALVTGALGADGANGFAVAAVAGCVSFVLVNHALLAVMLRLARGLTVRKSGLFRHETLATDFALAALAPVVVVLWASSPALVAFALAPLLLVHRSFAIPALREEVRHDPKTGLYNARHFAKQLDDELQRARTLGQELSLIVADLDLLRDINNVHGHLAGDAVICGIAETLRRSARDTDVAARFGGEEFVLLLPATSKDEATAIAERLRESVEKQVFASDGSRDTLRATLSLGVASTFTDGDDSNALIRAADAAVYQAKRHGRNRVCASPGAGTAEARRDMSRLDDAALADARTTSTDAAPTAVSPRLAPVSTGVVAWIALPVAAAIVSTLSAVLLPTPDVAGLLTLVLAAAALQTVALGWGRAALAPAIAAALAGVALFGPIAALPVALAQSACEWSARRRPIRQLTFAAAALCAAGSVGGLALGAVATQPEGWPLAVPAAGAAGFLFLAVHSLLLGRAFSFESTVRTTELCRRAATALAPVCLAAGATAGVVVLAFRSFGFVAFVVAAVAAVAGRELVALREARRRRRPLAVSARRESAIPEWETLARANDVVREHAIEAMESLSALVDARDSYTAGHSRRVAETSLTIGRELGLDGDELETLRRAALFHDIGKVGLPDSILLKAGPLTDEEWTAMQKHAVTGARIIARLGFLDRAVCSVRHHHENYDGTGYPDGLAGDSIPLHARIIRVADAFDSMLSSRVYRNARPLFAALDEIADHRGTHFCPRAADALLSAVGRCEAEDLVGARAA